MVRPRPAVALALIVGVMAACGGGDDRRADPSKVTTGGTPTPPFATPQVGECRGPMTEQIYDATSDTRPTVPCAEPHGSETFFVGALPEPMSVLSHSQAADLPDDTPGKRQALDECDKRNDEYVGVRRIGPDAIRPTNLSWAYYLPPPDDWDRGERWIRCDAVTRPLVEGRAERSTTERLQGIASRDQLPAEFRRCYREVTDSPNVEFLGLGSCDQPHEGEILGEIQVKNPPVDTLAGDLEALTDFAHNTYRPVCRQLMAPQIGLSAADLQRRTDIKVGSAVLDVADWATDPTARRVWCLAVTERPVTGTVEGLGTRRLPA